MKRDDFILDDGYEIVEDLYRGFAVPRDSPEHLKKYMLAAHRTFYSPNKSIDYMLKTYGDSLNVTTKYSSLHKLVYKGTAKVRKRIDEITAKRYKLKDLPDKFGLIAAGAALLRLQSSFKAALFLCDQGMSYESHCISKLILEQIAWAFAVHRIEDRKLYKIQPSKSVNKLKPMFPDIGKTYGRLNEEAHIDTKLIYQLVNFEEDGPLVVLRSMHRSLRSCLMLLQLADIYGVYMELIYKLYYSTFEYINITGTTAKLNSDRDSLKELKDYRQKIKEYEKKKKA